MKRKLILKFKSLNNSKGFTLIEILVASVILAFVVLGATTVTNNSLVTKERVLSEDSDFFALETALTRMQKDFAQVWSPLYYSEVYKTENKQGGGDNFIDPNDPSTPFAVYAENANFKGPSKSLHPIPRFKLSNGSFEFFSQANRRKYANTKESSFTWIRYQLESMSPPENLPEEERKRYQEANRKLVRYTFSDNPYNKEKFDNELVKGFPLIEFIKEFKLTFWNPKGERWTDNLSSIKDGESLIHGIKVQLVWISIDGDEVEIERIYRPIWPKYIPPKLEDKNKGNNNN